MRESLTAGDPWASIATPRLPRRLPRVLEIEQVERLLAVVDADLASAGTATGGTAGRSRAIALRDRAIVETAYAAGLRISELAGATVGELDLRRGELRVLGKGRKERIGLLGRPARHALEEYLADGRPVLLARGRTLPGSEPAEPTAGRVAEPPELFLNRAGGGLGVRGLRLRLPASQCPRLGIAGQRLAALEEWS